MPLIAPSANSVWRKMYLNSIPVVRVRLNSITVVAQKPWVSSAASLAEEKNFYLPSLSFRSRSESGVAGNNKQIYKAEMRQASPLDHKSYQAQVCHFLERFAIQVVAHLEATFLHSTPCPFPFPPARHAGGFGQTCGGCTGHSSSKFVAIDRPLP